MTIKEFRDPPVFDTVLNNDMLAWIWNQWFQDLKHIQTEWDIIEAVIDPSSVAANTSAAQAHTITQVLDAEGNTITLGADDVIFGVGDYIVKIIKPTLSAGLIIDQGRVTGTNEITIDFANVTAGAIDAGSETYTLIVLKG